ncbi:hypothetical protein [Pseudoclavibacter sp. AY1H1]|uniref:hypothetical protein n=1 Tax=Pseudoclavibacter sp. AY1H1 TaxID=2080584 RepID=UPI000CE79432|nr:hypothetical protein [Pseudoclavibacter sp. AY1H1]PPF39970.1 hypothetical protein C5E05_01795 [Pseudoclavibacter sp. AY1H1]
MATVIDGVRYANGEEPRSTTAGPGQPKHSPFGEFEKRLERIEELIGIDHAEVGAPEGAAVTTAATGEKRDGNPDAKQDGEPPAKRPTARRVETK